MNKLYEILDTVSLGVERAVLATIIKVEGSAYRKEGTCVLFTESGNQIGIISIGCLEDDLAIRAENLLNDPKRLSERIMYDMSAEDDLGWGRGVGCNGKIHILLEEVTTDVRERLMDLYVKLQKGLHVIAIKDLSSIPNMIQTVYQTKKKHLGFQESELYELIRKNRLNRLVEEKYYQYFQPKHRLFIFGAGADAMPLANLAIQTDFSVFIWDWRPEYLCSSLFPGVTFVENTEDITLNSNDLVVLMTHDFQKDKEIFRKLIKVKLLYLGVLGPRKRTARLLDEEKIPSQITSPVGLKIGAEGPDEIAVSIIGDLIRVKRGVASFEQTENSGNISGRGEKYQVRK